MYSHLLSSQEAFLHLDKDLFSLDIGFCLPVLQTQMSFAWPCSILCSPAGWGPCTAVPRVGHECVSATDDSASKSVCYMSEVLQKTLPTELGALLQFCMFLGDKLKLKQDSSKWWLHRTQCSLSHAFLQKSLKSGAMLFLLMHEAYLEAVASQNTMKCEGSRRRQSGTAPATKAIVHS